MARFGCGSSRLRKQGSERAPLSELQGGDAAENAAILQAIFAGEKGPRRNIVLVNAAATLVTTGMAEDIRSGIEHAARAIDSGAASKTLAALVEFGKQAR